jgi:predicted DNA-binding protein with PD1-like motif
MADKKVDTVFEGKYEIVSLVGTVAGDYAHLHLSISDSNGIVTGGHLLNGSLIYTTAELVLVHFPAIAYERALDPTYGYSELLVKPVK